MGDEPASQVDPNGTMFQPTPISMSPAFLGSFLAPRGPSRNNAPGGANEDAINFGAAGLFGLASLLRGDFAIPMNLLGDVDNIMGSPSFIASAAGNFQTGIGTPGGGGGSDGDSPSDTYDSPSPDDGPPQQKTDQQQTGNDDRNPAQDKKLSPGEIQRLKDSGEWDHRDKGDHGGQTDLYKDKNGNIYQKPKGGTGYGEPIGININDVTKKAAAVGVGVGVGVIIIDVISTYWWVPLLAL